MQGHRLTEEQIAYALGFHDDWLRRRLDKAKVRRVLDNPEAVQLMRVDGIGFERIDELAEARDSDGRESR